jgi:hypothetical protein
MVGEVPAVGIQSRHGHRHAAHGRGTGRPERPVLDPGADARDPRRDNQLVDVAHGRYLASHIAGSRYAEVDGDDYLPFVGDAEAILAEIEEFLTGGRPTIERDRVLATVQFTDIVGSTEKAAVLGDAAWLPQRHHQTVRGLPERHRRRESAGDGFLPPSTVPPGPSGLRWPSLMLWPTSASRYGPGCTVAHGRVRASGREGRRDRGAHRGPRGLAGRAGGGARVEHREGPRWDRVCPSRMPASASRRACRTVGP